MNSSDGVYMDIPVVRGMAKKFQEIADILRMVSKVLEALALMLKTTAFVGGVGLAAYRLVEQFKQVVNTVADNCEELGKDLNTSVDAYERGDLEGATRFY
jgi:predicted urease superfamily metal-dependent hydrolase